MVFTYRIWVSARSCPDRRIGLILGCCCLVVDRFTAGGFREGGGDDISRRPDFEFLAVVRLGGALLSGSTTRLPANE